MSLAAVVQHLQVLEESGIIRSEKLGRIRTCTLQPGGLQPLTDWLTARRIEMERKFDRLGVLLTEDATGEQEQEQGESS